MRIAARTTKATVAVLAATALLAGCAKESATPAGSTHLPVLHIGSDSGGGPVAAAAVAPGPMVASVDGGPANFGEFDGYVLAGTLPTTPTQAPVWRWASTQATSDAVAKLAAALGVDGTPVRHAHGWAVSSASGQVRVGDAAGQPWSFERSDLGACDTYPLDSVDIDDAPDSSTATGISGFGCAIGVPAQPPSPVEPVQPGATAPALPNNPSPTAVPVPVVPPTIAPTIAPPAPVGEATARSIAAPLISALGITGPEQVDADGSPATVTIAPTVGGLATEGIETTITVDATAIESASGRLTEPTMGDVYPLRTAAAGFTELNDEPRPMIARYCGPIELPLGAPVPGVASGGAASPASGGAASGGGASGAGGAPASAPAAPASPVAVPTLPVAPIPVPNSCPPAKPTPVTGATLGLLLEHDSSTASSEGSDLLVPAWYFDIQGSTSPNAVDAIDPAFVAPNVVIPGGVNIATPDVVGPGVGVQGSAPGAVPGAVPGAATAGPATGATTG